MKKQTCPQATDEARDAALAAGYRARQPSALVTGAVYTAIVLNADPYGRAQLTHAKIAKQAGCSYRTIGRAVAALRDAGVLTVTTGSGRSESVYQLLQIGPPAPHRKASTT